MKAGQFWILLVGSVLVSILLVKTVFLQHALDVEQRILVDRQETVSTTSTYETAWKQLAVKIYQAGHEDQQMIDLLKSEGVNIFVGAPPPPPGTSTTNGPIVPGPSSKPQVGPQAPSHP